MKRIADFTYRGWQIWFDHEDDSDGKPWNVSSTSVGYCYPTPEECKAFVDGYKEAVASRKVLV